jgi:hypothetical protein
MSEKKRVFNQFVKHIGYWNFKKVYDFSFEWFKDEKYDIYEEKYDERLGEKGKEVIIKWKCEKKISDYFRNVIELKWHILNMEKVEIERDGEKEKTNKGEIKITITADLERDYEENWEKKASWKFLRGIYDKYIMRTTMDQYEERLGEKAASFFSQLKSYLQLEGK